MQLDQTRTADQTGPDHGPDRDLWTFAGLTVIAVCAAVMSFAAWSGLAVQVGMDQTIGPVRLGWLLPLSIDAYALVATRVWLMDRSVSDQTRALAGRTAAAAIALSFAGNALFHLVSVLDLQAWSGWWSVVVLVSGLPAVLFGQAVHLIVRMRSDQRSTDRSVVPVPSSYVRAGRLPPRSGQDFLVDRSAPVPSAQPRPVPVPKPGETKRSKRPVSDHLDQIRTAWPDRIPTKREVMGRTGVRGSQTAMDLIGQLKAERERPSADPDPAQALIEQGA